MGWGYLGIICAVCALCCAIGFKKFVWFLSIGYGFAIIGGGITVLIFALANGWANGAIWLLIRKTLNEDAGGDKKMPIFVLITIWIMVAVLYTAQVSPVFDRYYNYGTTAKAEHDFIVPLIGMAISVIGLVLETIADKQKSAQKKENPKMVATKGLYKIVRCPNYFGEILFWTGVFVSGVTAYRGVGQWIVAILALIAIVY